MAHARPPGRHRRGRLLTGEGGFSGLGPPLGACGPHGGARRLLHGVHVWIYFHLGRTPRPPSRPSFRHRSPIDCLTESLSATLGLCFCSCSIEGETWTGARASSEVPRCETAHGRRGAPRNSGSDLSPRRRSGGSSTGPRARSSQQPLHFKRASDSQRSRREQRAPPSHPGSRFARGARLAGRGTCPGADDATPTHDRRPASILHQSSASTPLLQAPAGSPRDAGRLLSSGFAHSCFRRPWRSAGDSSGVPEAEPSCSARHGPSFSALPPVSETRQAPLAFPRTSFWKARHPPQGGRRAERLRPPSPRSRVLTENPPSPLGFLASNKN